MAQPLPPPPDDDALAELLGERYSLEQIAIDAKIRNDRPCLVASIDRRRGPKKERRRYVITVTHVDGGEPDVGWDLVVDALDALVGTLVESDYAHRDLPAGDGVSFQDGVFSVQVEALRPDLEAEAARILGASDPDEH